MAVKRDIRNLPNAPLSGGWLPDENPDWAPILAQAWAEQEIDRAPLPMSVADRHWRASWSSSRCDRQLGYHMLGYEPSDELTLADHWRFWLGKLVHTQFQAAAIKKLEALGYTVTAEADIDLMPLINGAAHGDLMVMIPMIDKIGRLVVVELKTINGMGFKETACTFRGKPPKGPKIDHVIQAAVVAARLAADEIKIIYLAMENVGKEMAAWIDVDEIGRFCAQWTITPDVFMPLAEREAQRVALVDSLVQIGKLPDRQLWDNELQGGRPIIQDPTKGTGLIYGIDGSVIKPFKTWRCAYCPFQKKCITDG